MIDDFDASTWPESLRHLEPLARRWAISDDVDRSLAQETASDADLLALLTTVEPHFDAINQYLDSFADGPDEDACVLGTLAECAVEARLELEERGVELSSE
jgi:hypothetical protein